MKKKLLSLLLASAMMVQMVSGTTLPVQAKDKAVAQTTEVKAATLELDTHRAPDNVVTLNWNKVDGAVSYNVYDMPYGAAETKLANTKETTFVADKLEVGKVHTLTVKAVNGEGTEFVTSNVKKVGLVEKIDTLKDGVQTLIKDREQLKLPVSDFSDNMNYIGETIQDDRYHYWCCSSVEDEDGRVHLFMARVPKDIPFIPGWKTSSEIVHFVGDSLEGPFTEVGTPFSAETLKQFGQQSAHNPQIRKIGDKYVLLYIARYNYVNDSNQGYQVTCMATIDKLPTEAGSDTLDKWTLATDTGIDISSGEQVAEAGVQNGVILRYGLKAVNPDMMKVKDANGNDEYIMYFKGNERPNVEAPQYFLFYATSPKLEGPYTFKGKATDAKYTIEDPSVFEWKGKYFMLTYDLGKKTAGPSAVGMLIPSRDPHHFSFEDAWITGGLFSDYVQMPEGWTFAYNNNLHIGRPYMIFENGQPKYFIGANAVNVDGNKVTRSYVYEYNKLPKHKVAVDDNLKGGTIEIVNDAKEAEIFDDIIFKVIPDEGFELVKDSIKITSKDRVEHSYTSKVETLEDGTYRFMMPSGDVTITAQFKGMGSVERVEITPNKIEVIKGKTHNFFSSVIGNGDYLKTVEWSVEGTTAKTTISEDGVLNVDAAETAEILTVKATSKDDETKSAIAEVTVVDMGSNLALGLEEDAYIGSSHHENAPGTVKCFIKNAFDGFIGYPGQENLNKIWTPAGTDAEPWIGVNFGEKKEFNTVKLYDFPNPNVGHFKSVDIEVSDDGAKWEKIGSYTFEGTEKVKECAFDTVEKQYVRVSNMITDKMKNGKYVPVHLAEMEVYNEVEVDAPAIAAQPEDQKVELGEKATFSVNATGADLTYQWQVSKDNGETWEIIEGANTAEYTTEALTVENNGQLYRCIISNVVESISTETSALEVFCEHAWDTEYTVDVEATCTEDGSKSIHCDKCGEVKDVQIIPALGHAFSDWKVVKEATATEDGCKERACTRCDYTETEVIPATGETTPPDVDGGDDSKTEEPVKPENPDSGKGAVPTGDTSNIMLWSVVLAFGSTVIMTVAKRRRKED